MKTLLVPVDFSDCAPFLLAEAVRFARAFDARVLLLHASELPHGVSETTLVTPPDGGAPVPARELLRRDAEAHMAPYVKQLSDGAVTVATQVQFGHVAPTILASVRRERAEMVLMGTHGRTGLARATLGSVAEDVIRHADVPVIVVRTQHRPDCASRDCAHCTVRHTEVERAVDFESDG